MTLISAALARSTTFQRDFAALLNLPEEAVSLLSDAIFTELENEDDDAIERVFQKLDPSISNPSPALAVLSFLAHRRVDENMSVEEALTAIEQQAILQDITDSFVRVKEKLRTALSGDGTFREHVLAGNAFSFGGHLRHSEFVAAALETEAGQFVAGLIWKVSEDRQKEVTAGLTIAEAKKLRRELDEAIERATSLRNVVDRLTVANP